MARPLSEDIRERCRSCGGDEHTGGCGTVCNRGVVHCEVVAALSGDRLGCADGRTPQTRLKPHRALIMERLGQTPHLALRGLKAELAARGSRSRTMRCGSSEPLFEALRSGPPWISERARSH
jgi:hypothetical protein